LYQPIKRPFKESQYPLIWAVASDPGSDYIVWSDGMSQYPLIWAVASDWSQLRYRQKNPLVSIPSHLGSSFGRGVGVVVGRDGEVSIPSHLGSSFGHNPNAPYIVWSQVSIPSHLGSSFGPPAGPAANPRFRSQYPLIWAVASDEAAKSSQDWKIVSQYPLIWAVASDSIPRTNLPFLLCLNTLSFGQ